MNAQRCLLITLVAIVLSASTVWLSPSARAASSDAEAIAEFLSIGFANADTHFTSIRGAVYDPNNDGVEVFEVSKAPDSAYYSGCRVFHYLNASPPPDKFICYSKLHGVSAQDLFKMGVDAVEANLPSGYTSSGPKQLDQPYGTPYQVWSRAGGPVVRLTLYPNPYTNDGRFQYTIEIQ